MIYFSAINLWCNKNLVDLEFIIWNIFVDYKAKDVNFIDNPEDKKVEFLIINTCWFLSSSRQEAEEIIDYYDKLWKKIILVWCYIPVKNNEFLSKLKNLYKIIPQEKILEKKIFKLSEKSDLKEKILNNYFDKIHKNQAFIASWNNTRFPFNLHKSYEYVKIAEGCNNNCSFCLIPKIRWTQKSRDLKNIITEIKSLVNIWIKEIEIIAQDTTRYWIDLYGEAKLFDLLEQIEKLDLDFKFRIFYLYPDILTFENLKKLKNFKKFVPYFDLPFQHINKNILKKMWRFYDEGHIFKLLDFIKKEFKESFIHTNFIVWFPWETENDFEELIQFAKKYEFDSVSLFWYHDEKLASSSKLDWKVDSEIIIKRVEKLWKVLNKIYDKKEKQRIWKKSIWFIENISKDKIWVRWELKAPEIDELDYVSPKNIISWKIKMGEKVEYIINY